MTGCCSIQIQAYPPADLAEVLSSWLRYALSFVYVGIYWVNHQI